MGLGCALNCQYLLMATQSMVNNSTNLWRQEEKTIISAPVLVFANPQFSKKFSNSFFFLFLTLFFLGEIFLRLLSIYFQHYFSGWKEFSHFQLTFRSKKVQFATFSSTNPFLRFFNSLTFLFLLNLEISLLQVEINWLQKKFLPGFFSRILKFRISFFKF